MTTFLLRRFVSGWDAPDTPGVRATVGRLSGIVGILCNLLLFAAKLLIGTLSGSLSICADAMNNLSDAASAIVTLIGFRLAEKPADADHPFGHARFEYLSGLAVAGLIMLIGFELLKSLWKINKVCRIPCPHMCAVNILQMLWQVVVTCIVHTPQIQRALVEAMHGVLYVLYGIGGEHL